MIHNSLAGAFALSPEKHIANCHTPHIFIYLHVTLNISRPSPQGDDCRDSKTLWYGPCRWKLTQSSIYSREIELQTSYWQFNSKPPPRERLFVFCCCLGSWICYNQTSEINKHDPIENVPRSSSGHTEDCRARWCVYDDLGVRDWKTYFRRWVYHLWPKENTGMELIFTCRYLKLFIQRQRTYLFRIHSLIVSHLPLTYNIKVVWVSNWNVNMGVRYKVFP